MEAKYGQIAENARINQAIYDCFIYLNEKEQGKFVKKFKKIPHQQIQVMHTFSELILGAYLAANDMRVEHERQIDGKTPDWSILDSALNVVAIVEMVYHHLDSGTEENICSQRQLGKSVIGYWPNSNDPNFLRLYSQIQEKASKYKTIITKIKIPLVVAVFMDFLSGVDVQETINCLTEGDDSLFKLYPDLSGVIHFEEANRGSYQFSYIENPFALRKIGIPSGCFA